MNLQFITEECSEWCMDKTNSMHRDEELQLWGVGILHFASLPYHTSAGGLGKSLNPIKPWLPHP